MRSTTPHPYTVIGLTGGIGSGKSTVCALLAEKGIPVIDTDEIARQAVEPGTEGLKAVIKAFGTDFLTETGTLDRAKLRERVFSQAEAKRKLESILHPLIRRAMLNQIQACQKENRRGAPPIIVVAIPLLVETLQAHQKPGYLDEIWVVDCPEALQIERAASRDGQDRDQIETILNQQASRQARLKWADRVIENIGSLNDLIRQINTILKDYPVKEP